FVRSLKRRARDVRRAWLSSGLRPCYAALRHFLLGPSSAGRGASAPLGYPRTRSARQSALLGPAALGTMAMKYGRSAGRATLARLHLPFVIRRLDRLIQCFRTPWLPLHWLRGAVSLRPLVYLIVSGMARAAPRHPMKRAQ